MSTASSFARPGTDPDTDRRKRLNTMRSVATGLLVGMACLFALAESRTGGNPAWHYVAAFSEAAMVGALADWFAVVALFRHPMGIPVWHSAIIPSSKDEIAQNLGEFVETHFVTVDAIVTRIRQFDPAMRASDWLRQPRVSAKVSELVTNALRAVIANEDDTKLREAVRDMAFSHLAGIELMPLVTKLSDELMAEERHNEVLDLALRKSLAWLESDGAEAKLTKLLDEVDHLLVRALSGTIAGTIKTGASKMFKAALDDPAHPLRKRYEGVLRHGLIRLKNDLSWTSRLKEFQNSTLEDQRLKDAVDAIWIDLKSTLINDLDRRQPRLGLNVATFVTEGGAWLSNNEHARNWINKALCDAVLPLVEVNRGKVAKFIQTQINDWSKAEMTERLELAVGRDLQFIRINGTIVGGLVGVGLYILVQVVHRIA